MNQTLDLPHQEDLGLPRPNLAHPGQDRLPAVRQVIQPRQVHDSSRDAAHREKVSLLQDMRLQGCAPQTRGPAHHQVASQESNGFQCNLNWAVSILV